MLERLQPAPPEMFDVAELDQLAQEQRQRVTERATRQLDDIDNIVDRQTTKVEAWNNDAEKTQAQRDEAKKWLDFYSEIQTSPPELGRLKLERQIARSYVDSSRTDYAKQVALRHRTTSPFSLRKSPQPIDQRIEGVPGKDDEDYTKYQSSRPERLMAAQKRYELGLKVARSIDNDLIEETNSSDVEQLQKQQAFLTMLGDGSGKKGELFELNDQIRDERLLRSGHYEKKNGEAVEKQGKFHQGVLKFYRGWHRLTENKVGKAGKLVGLGVVGAVAASTGLATLGAVGAGLVYAGTRLAKSGGTFLAERGAGSIEYAKAEAEWAEDSLMQARRERDLRVRRNEDLGLEDHTNQSLVFFTESANRAHEKNRRRMLFTAAGLLGGAAVSQLVDVPGISKPDWVSKIGIPDWLPGLPFYENGKFDQPGLPLYENGDFDMPDLWPFGGENDTETPADTPNTVDTEGPEDVTPPEDEIDPPADTVVDIDRDVTVGNGDGYSHVFTDQVEAAADVELTPEQSWDLYTYVDENTAQDGNFFKGKGESYLMNDGNWGIASPGDAEMRAHTERMMQQWLLENEEDLKAA